VTDKNVNPFPLPEPIVRDAADPVDLPILTLSLYRKLAALSRTAEDAVSTAEKRIYDHVLATGKTVAALAAEHFDFERVMRRIEPELEAAGLHNVRRVLDVFRRGWTAVLTREQVEVRDLTNQPFSDEIAELVEVNGSIEDAAVTEALVRETLAPLVLHRGHVICKAIVNKSVPFLSVTPEKQEDPS
jgi:hypothetical protein